MDSDYQSSQFSEKIKACYEELRKEFDESPVLAELVRMLDPEKKESLQKVIRDSHEHLLDIGMILYKNGFEEGRKLKSLSNPFTEEDNS